MIHYISLMLQESCTALNMVHYISFRAPAALLTVLFLSLIGGGYFITASQKFFRSKTRDYTPDTHKLKGEMPTMGGIFILGVIIITALLWCDITDLHIWIMLFCLVSFGAIGFWDDWLKIKTKRGISEKFKFRAQILCATITILLWFWLCEPSTKLCIPFLKTCTPDIGYLLIPWAIFIIIATSNAVNLTDGLDGLALGSLIPNFATFSIMSYLTGHIIFAQYLHLPFTGTAELSILGVILVGASLGFLWFNAYPAQIFIGDVGSLSLGASLGLMAVMTRQEFLLIISGGLFIVETVSVLLQVFSYRYFKRRIFKMAPIHHHFELLGWPEAKITVRFGIISLILCLMALITLKIR